MIRRIALSVALLTSLATAASATGFADPAAAGFAPRVPVSAFARPAAWFDPGRLKISSVVSVGSSFGSSTTQALSVTSLTYQFQKPMMLRVNIGNAFGVGQGRNGSFFLEGVDFAWQPSQNSLFRVQFKDVRTPLQYGANDYGYGPSWSGVDPWSR